MSRFHWKLDGSPQSADEDHLPLAAPVGSGHDADPVHPAAPIRVLIVDDDHQVGRQLRDLLTDFGHAVVGVVSNSIQALVLIKTLRPDVVVTDLRMPSLNGIELTAQVRQLPSPPAVVMVSAYDDLSLQQQSRAAGAHAYVVKGAPGELVHRAVLAAAASTRSIADPS
jgi:two-component system response regulator DevR